MITRLRLENFKNFKDAELHFGALTTLIGSNASGKSNLRDALRFLHGIGRGYTIAEIIGEKYVEGGVLQWRGIRGGLAEITYHKSESFTLAVSFQDKEAEELTYTIQVSIANSYGVPIILAESLVTEQRSIFTFRDKNGQQEFYPQELFEREQLTEANESDRLAGAVPSKLRLAHREQPILTQFQGHQRKRLGRTDGDLLQATIQFLSSMRFFDLSGEALRYLSFPGQTLLGDRGENLSSLLKAISDDPERKASLLHWLRELTPMDVTDLDFVSDQIGRILVNLVESSGSRVSAFSASDGTLRFLALLALLLAPDLQNGVTAARRPTQLYFFEELENGLHPARLYLLIQLVEQEIKRNNIQVVTTTHSPQYLRFLSEASLNSTSLLYRLTESTEGKIRRIVDIPDLLQILETQDLGRLHESGWFEDAVAFLAESTPEAEAGI